MNDIHSQAEWIYKPRRLADRLRRACDSHPVVLLSGARQVGKSTLLREEEPFRSFRYVTLDDFDSLAQAERDPGALWAGSDSVVIDEAQRLPGLLSAVKRVVDERRRAMRFVLSGSANLMMMSRVSESLAGRAVLFTLLPMTAREEHPAWSGAENALERLLAGELEIEPIARPTRAPVLELLVRGFMPPVVEMRSTEAQLEWWEGYVSTYLERDVRSLTQVASLSDFRRVMAALALRTGQLLNQTDVSRDVGVSQPTVHRYLSLIETTGLLERLPAYSVNRGKRLVKAPKVQWADPGLVAYLAGHHDPESLSGSRELGGVFETLVLLGLRGQAQLLTPRPSFYYWRTRAGTEVDFVVEHGRSLAALEVKLTDTPRHAHLDGLREFIDQYPETRAAALVHAGDEVRRMDEKIIALPWWMLS